MALDATTKELLNKFSDSQPALNDNFNPRPASGIKVGDLIDQGSVALDLQGAALVAATYDVAVQGGAIGSYALDMEIPADAIITRVYTRTLTTFAEETGGAPAATIELLVGAQSIKAATDFSSTDWTGVEDQIDATQDSTIAVPILVTATGKLTVAVAGDNLTDGKIKIWVEYLKA